MSESRNLTVKLHLPAQPNLRNQKYDLWLKTSLFTGRLKFLFADNATGMPNKFSADM